MKPIERLERIAEDKYGMSAAVSVNYEGDGWTARVWNAKGYEVETNRSQRKVEAIMGLVRRLALPPLVPEATP